MTVKKPAEWTADDFRSESARILNEVDTYSEDVMVGAMMLAACRDGTRSLKRLAESIGTREARIRPYYDNLRRNRVFGSRKVRCNWFGDDGGIAFVADVCVASGLLNRVGTTEAA